MPYSQPASSPRSPSPSRSHQSRKISSHSYQNQNHNASAHSLGRPGHRRSYSSQAHYGFESNSQSASTKSSSTGTDSTRFSNEQSINGNSGTRGAWGSLGSLPRRHSSATTPTLNSTSKFRIGDRRGSSGSDDDDENDVEDDRGLPPLKLKVQVLPSFSEGIPFPKSSADSPVRMGPMSIPTPANVTLTRPSAPTRTSSSPAMITPEVTPAPSAAATRAASPAVILLSNGKPLRSSLKGSRVSSLLSSPMGSTTNTPSVSPSNSVKNSPDNSTVNSTVTSPITSPGVSGTSAPSFASLANFGIDSAAKFLLPPSFGGHVRAQSAPSPPMTPGHGIEAVLDSTWAGAISPSSEAPLSPGLTEPLMSPLSPRSVHFPSLSADLERVRVFRKEARPSSLLVTRKERDQHTSTANHGSNDHSNGAESAEGSGTDVKSGGEETETETETDREYGYGYNAGYWGNWGGRGLWEAAAPSRSSAAKVLSSDQPTISAGAFPFPRLPRLGRTRSAENKAEDDDESSSSSSGSGGRIRILKTGSGPRFVKKDEEKEQVASTDKGTMRKMKLELDVPSPACPIPRPDSIRDALSGSNNIFLEEVHFQNFLSESSSQNTTEPFVLEGTFLVRNIMFEKNVYVRFTMDDWSTVSEVRGKWVNSCGRSHLISLASKSGAGIGVPRTVGDLIALSNCAVDENSSEWDRFAFRINLPSAVGPGRVVELVGRFTVGNAGGEWWDNCGGKNWRVGFKEVEITGARGLTPILLKTSPSPDPVPILKSETKREPVIASATLNLVPVPVFDVAADPAPASLAINPPPEHASVKHDIVSQDQPSAEEALEASDLTAGPLPKETKVEGALQFMTIEKEWKTSELAKEGKEVKERAPKPTGLGSFSGLGGVFWPWRNATSTESQKPTVHTSASSSSVEPPDSLPPTPLVPASEVSGNASIHGTVQSVHSAQGNRDLPASATVEVLSMIPPAPSDRRLTKFTPTYEFSSSLTASKVQSPRERIPSVSSVSSTDSVDSMMEVPMLERSSSLSSVSTDGEYSELSELKPSEFIAMSPTFNSGDAESKHDLTPVPKDARVAWSSNDDRVGEDQTGFFDHSGPGSGGVGIASPSAGLDKPLDTDPLYRAFVQQWCFAGTGTGTPVALESPTHVPNRNRLQVM